MSIPVDVQAIAGLGFTLMATWPMCRRGDILGEADLAEEVARVASLTKLEGKPMLRTHVGVPKPCQLVPTP